MQPEFVIYLDENHCRNKKILEVLARNEVSVEIHLDHFERGTPDVEWLPVVGEKGWSVVTTDKSIKRREVERNAVKDNCVRFFCFTNNNMSGEELAIALETALPRMQKISREQLPPFIATITPSGAVNLIEIFTRDNP